MTLRRLSVVCRYDQQFFYLHPARIIARTKTAEDDLHNALRVSLPYWVTAHVLHIHLLRLTPQHHCISYHFQYNDGISDNSFTELFKYANFTICQYSKLCYLHGTNCYLAHITNYNFLWHNSKIVQTP